MRVTVMGWFSKVFSRPYQKPADNDVFISYRTIDANSVRIIAEQLIAQDVPVWFDEYRITTDQRAQVIKRSYEENIRFFEKIISDAIGTCSIAICFTSPEYARSDYCKTEADIIIKRHTSIEKIIDIHDPDFSGFYSTNYRNDNVFNRVHKLEDIEDIWNDLTAELAFQTRPLVLETPRPNFVTMEWLESVRYSMDFGGWQQTDGRRVENNEARDVRGGMFSRKSNGVVINATVRTGLQSGVYRYQFTDLENRIVFIQKSSMMMEQFIKMFPPIPGLRPRLLGTHFIEASPLGHSESLGYAFFTLYNRPLKTWFRQYSIVLPNPLRAKIRVSPDLKMRESNLGSEIEICVIFAIAGASFKQYCSVGYLMDRVVRSLTFPQ
jgi:hypothetical protein